MACNKTSALKNPFATMYDRAEDERRAMVARARTAKYTLYTSGIMELMSLIILITILIASSSELYGVAAVNISSIAFSFLASTLASKKMIKSTLIPMLWVPAVMADTILVFSFVYASIFCINGNHDTRFDLVLGARICQGFSFDSGLFEYLCATVSAILLVITIQAAFTSTLLFPSDSSDYVVAMPIPRISIIFFTGVWMVRYGGYMYGVLCLVSVLMQVLDFAIMSRWAIPLSFVIELPVLMPPIIHLIGWCSRDHESLCIHDNLATAWMFLALGIVRFVISCVQMSALRRRLYVRKMLMSTNPVVDVTTAAFHVAIGTAGTFFAIYNAQYGLNVTIGVSVLAHAVGSGLVFTIQQANADHWKAISAGAIGLFVFACVMDALTISVFAMSVDSKCPTWLPGWLPVKCVGPNGALIALSLSTLALCLDIISCVSAVAHLRVAPFADTFYEPVSNKREADFTSISLRRQIPDGEERVWSRRGYKQ